jgi:uncharacterized membrane protein YphA (DoxX/SURF4 family)
MNIALWIAQIVLAIVFTVSGTQKATRSREALVASGQTGVALYPMPVVRLTAVSELLGVLGIILPWATGVLPWLTPVAAAGFAVVMVGAITAHIRLREGKNIAITVSILAVCVFVILGRTLWS